jgi:copper/silver efflux system protein
MLKRIIAWSARNPFLVLLLSAAALGGGVLAIMSTPLEALPDLSDVQVIVQTDYEGQAAQIVEDQVTYPIASEMLKVPGARTVRAYSFFGVSFVYVIFEDGTDLYWARSRVLESLSGIAGRLPAAARAALGPDATGLGWIYQYVLEDRTGERSLAELRSLQDWYVRYQLTGVQGVSEVASIGGFEKAYEVTVDPTKLRAYGIPVTRVMRALQGSNEDAGAMMLELTEREYMVRGLGYLRGIGDIENVVVGATAGGTAIRVADIGTVQLAAEVRRGIADLDGRGEAVGGIVVMRSGENALATIDRVKAKLDEVHAGLPDGVVIRPVYDRSELIHDAIGTLRLKLTEELIVVGLITLLFLFHARSALVAIIMLPLSVLIAFIAMRVLGVGANIMSLGGIAIAIGAMVDAAVVMVENTHKHLERALATRPGNASGSRIRTQDLPARERVDIVIRAAQEVGPALFFSLIIITVSFLPVFALEAQEGRLFKPLAWTKTLSMAAAALLSVTLVPVLLTLFVRGRIHTERSNPVSRVLKAAYRPVMETVLRHRWPVLAGAASVLVLTWIPLQRIGSEFMPPLDEGTILYMPTTVPGIGVATAREMLQRQDSILATFPEVASVFGKAGRATTATDPAGFDMFETTIALKPQSEWRPGMTSEKLVSEMDAAVRFAGIANAWTMPIQGRIDMLATGIRTPVGIKIFGPDLATLERIGGEIEQAIHMVPGTRSVFAERAVSGYYLDIDIDRTAAARYGINIDDVQAVIGAAVGGMTITQTVEGRERYGVRLRYPHELRDSPDRLADVLIPMGQTGQTRSAMPGGMSGMGGSPSGGGPAPQIPLGAIADIRPASGPMVVKTENAFPTAWVYIDVDTRDIGGYVRAAQDMVEEMVVLPQGYTLQWSGQFEYMERARAKLAVVVPATLLIIFLLLWLNFRSVAESLIVLLSLPFALVGGVVFMALLGYQWSVASAIGFIALAGVAAETGVVMLIYLDGAWRHRQAAGLVTPASLQDAVMEGAVERLRPKMMTVMTTIMGLLPILWGMGTGASVMKRIAAPMVGGMVSSTILTLIVIPALYSLWQEQRLARTVRHAPAPARPAAPRVAPAEPVAAR